MGVKQTIGKKVRARLSLGKYLQGKSIAMPVIMKQDTYGLGYKLDGKERNKKVKNKREERMASLKGDRMEGEPMSFPYLRETFRSAGIEHDDIQPRQTALIERFKKLTINAIEDKEMKGDDIRALVRPHPLGYKLTN